MYIYIHTDEWIDKNNAYVFLTLVNIQPEKYKLSSTKDKNSSGQILLKLSSVISQANGICLGKAADRLINVINSKYITLLSQLGSYVVEML